MNPTPVQIRRAAPAKFVATNARGAEITIGRSQDGADFSPVELLMAALGACATLSADSIVTRRLGEDAPLDMVVTAEKDEEADRVTSVDTKFDIDASSLSEAEQAKLIKLVAKAVELTCTVSHSVEPGTPVTVTFA
ncbi:OsmC family protein [Kibdelosporangium philippinense]|uniref:OsmC family protein n=2 Tax=Kibdelosporangium philippinense TaxID=211113 RepID=A0ABS8ZRL5_9PSEU|nr:OsmC family protein [Kibdelosporangium philippinense]MCE7009853.1 OsmC family protein [Kibdelosporangium philippinense]